MSTVSFDKLCGKFCYGGDRNSAKLSDPHGAKVTASDQLPCQRATYAEPLGGFFNR